MFELKLTGLKKVEYFGCIFYVSKIMKYMATDKDGTIYAYDKKPEIIDRAYEWSGFDNHYFEGVSAPFKYKGNWKESLQKI
jgi:hypothetical protein